MQILEKTVCSRLPSRSPATSEKDHLEILTKPMMTVMAIADCELVLRAISLYCNVVGG